MASVASASPSSKYSFLHPESGDDTESWHYVDSCDPASVGLVPSPTSSSLNGWGIVGYPNQNQIRNSPVAMSPLQLDHDLPRGVPPTSYPDHTAGASAMASTRVDSQLVSGLDDQQFFDSQNLFFHDSFPGTLDMPIYSSAFHGGMADMSGLGGLGMASATQPIDLGIPQQFRSDNNVPPWVPMNLKNQDFSVGADENNFVTQIPPQSSPAHSSLLSSPRSPPRIKQEPRKSVSPIRKVKSGGKVEKRRAEPSSKFVIMTPNLISQQSGKPNPFECFEAMRTTQRGRKGPLAHDTKESALQVRRLGACFCCHSRKVKCDKERPCKNCKKLTAQVPQIMCWQFGDFLPVLFPDFIRSHFKKDQMASFLGEHVKSFRVNGAELTCSVELFSGARFASTLTVPASFFTPRTAEILQHWHMNMGMNQMDLQPRGAAPIGIDPDNATQREELKRRAREYIQNLVAEPLYAEQVTDSIRSTQLPRKVLSIVQRYAQRSQSAMVKRALSIYVAHYVLTRQLCLTAGTVVNLQQQQITTGLVPRDGGAWMTARVLNRQIKAVLDELLLREAQSLFDGFARSLKPKLRREWAPCVAAFLALCLFMETVETAADTFVISHNEIALRTNRQHQHRHGRSAPSMPSSSSSSAAPTSAPSSTAAATSAAPPTTYRRDFALALVREIDNLPFKQFAYQFHQIYQTHTRDTGAKAFNPLVDADGGDGSSADLAAELDPAAADMVAELRELLQGDSWHELDFLVADLILPNQEGHPFPRDVSHNYTGRLVARFLLSFTDERYLFDGQY
ncbi:hypothetical protein GGS23DRAFT_602072 [Durotheca rogersii]|uniref:uncharacterized protein n=1 Tax=Durotheca rogersii TaxID=419775 RepID=UPI002220D8F6|nr:uncharacterized protein GGS23DRAFT_602072 [Durotheca rogersii]KAI5868182.1 hypothetical protein GGS23DRAFT_602072 [Durotheca rogersii]